MTQQRWSGPSWKHGNSKRHRKKRKTGAERHKECIKLHAFKKIEKQKYF